MDDKGRPRPAHRERHQRLERARVDFQRLREWISGEPIRP